MSPLAPIQRCLARPIRSLSPDEGFTDVVA